MVETNNKIAILVKRRSTYMFRGNHRTSDGFVDSFWHWEDDVVYISRESASKYREQLEPLKNIISKYSKDLLDEWEDTRYQAIPDYGTKEIVNYSETKNLINELNSISDIKFTDNVENQEMIIFNQWS